MAGIVGLIFIVAVFVAGRYAEVDGVGARIGAKNVASVPVLARRVDVVGGKGW